MNRLSFCLCAEGPTDDMLLPMVRWTLRQHLGPNVPISQEFSARRGTLAQRIRLALQAAAGCDLLIVHRDADRRDGRAGRITEIAAAMGELVSAGLILPPHVTVVPAVMSEAWLLFDEDAIRRAAGRPGGKEPLGLPGRRYDTVPKPKQVLNDALDRASGTSGRKLEKFQRDRRPFQVADQIDDFAPLRHLAAFKAFEADIETFADARSRAGRTTT